MTISISITPRRNIGIVKHRLRPELIQPDGSTFFVPSTVPLSAEPNDKAGIADPIFVEQPIWDYLKKINSPKSYEYTRSVGNLWDNRGDGRVVTVICGGNYVSWDEETDTHVRVVSFPVTTDTTQLDPTVDNWFHKPWLFWRATTIDGFGNIGKPGIGLDVYFMLIHGKTRLWLAKADLV